VNQPLDDGTLQDVHQPLDGNVALRELLGDHGEGGAGGPADAEGQMPGMAAGSRA
jgi:hypothetical protein